MMWGKRNERMIPAPERGEKARKEREERERERDGTVSEKNIIVKRIIS